MKNNELINTTMINFMKIILIYVSYNEMMSELKNKNGFILMYEPLSLLNDLFGDQYEDSMYFYIINK